MLRTQKSIGLKVVQRSESPYKGSSNNTLRTQDSRTERRLAGDPRTGQPPPPGIHKPHVCLVKQDVFYLIQNKLIIEFMKQGARERVHTNSGVGEPAYVPGNTPAPREGKWDRIVLLAPVQP